MNQEEINKIYAELCSQYGNLSISKKRIEDQLKAIEQKMVALDQLVPSLLSATKSSAKKEANSER